MAPIKLEYEEPPPLFFGVYPLTVGVQVICGFHALLCLFFISTASSVVNLHVDRYEVPASLQVVISAWHMLGITVIVGALIACRWRQEFPMQLYFYYLLLSDLAWGVATIWVAQQGDYCGLVSESLSSQRVGLGMSCAMVSAIWFLGLLSIWVVVAYCCYLVWQMKEHLRLREAAQLLSHHEDPLVKEVREGKYLGAGGKRRNPYEEFDTERYAQLHCESDLGLVPPSDPAAWATPTPGQQPDWGMLQVRSVKLA